MDVQSYADATAQVTPDTSAFATYNATQDSNQDVEPSIIAINLNGTVWGTTVYTKNVNGIPLNYFATTTDGVNYQRGQLALSGYQKSGDPLLSENSHTNPGIIYASGLLLGSSSQAIAVWQSNNGGVSWPQPKIVATNSASGYALDKPAIRVSEYSGSLGYVYVAWMLLNASNPSASQLWVAESTDGGLTFPTKSLVTTGNIEGPQIVIDPYNGYVYAIWTDFSLNAIRMSVSTSTDLQYWSSPETATTGNMVLPGPTGCTQNNCLGYLNDYVRAPSFAMARFNWVADKISIVWHEWEQGSPSNCNQLQEGSCKTDVYYISKSPSGWQQKVRINDIQTNDQFMPSLDFDSTGNMIVTYYDRRDDQSNIKYYPYMAHIDSSGNRLAPTAPVYTGFQSDPTLYPMTQIGHFIGDYEDNWSQDVSGVTYYLPAWVGIPSTGDIYFSEIQP